MTLQEKGRMCKFIRRGIGKRKREEEKETERERERERERGLEIARNKRYKMEQRRR